MSSIVKGIFGGTDRSAQNAQIAANREAAEFAKEMGAQARGDVLAIAPGIEQARLGGFQAALDLLGQTIPQQLGAFQQGNIAAQQQLASGLPQFQAALLGQPFDFGTFAPSQIQAPAASTFQQQLPQITGINQLLQAVQPAQAVEQPITTGVIEQQLENLFGPHTMRLLPGLVNRERQRIESENMGA
mgnify:CR=1 FL=1